MIRFYNFLHLQLQLKLIVPKLFFRFVAVFFLQRCSAFYFHSLSLTRHKQEFNEKIISDDSFSAVFAFHSEKRNRGENEIQRFKEFRWSFLIFSIN